MAKRFLAHQKVRLTAKAFEGERGIIDEHLWKFFPGLLASIRRVDIQRYIPKRAGEVSAYSVQKELNVLKHLLRLAVEWELFPFSPAQQVKSPRVPAGRVHYLQPTELRNLLSACPDWLRLPDNTSKVSWSCFEMANRCRPGRVDAAELNHWVRIVDGIGPRSVVIRQTISRDVDFSCNKGSMLLNFFRSLFTEITSLPLSKSFWSARTCDTTDVIIRLSKANRIDYNIPNHALTTLIRRLMSGSELNK